MCGCGRLGVCNPDGQDQRFANHLSTGHACWQVTHQYSHAVIGGRSKRRSIMPLTPPGGCRPPVPGRIRSLPSQPSLLTEPCVRARPPRSALKKTAPIAFLKAPKRNSAQSGLRNAEGSVSICSGTGENPQVNWLADDSAAGWDDVLEGGQSPVDQPADVLPKP